MLLAAASSLRPGSTHPCPHPLGWSYRGRQGDFREGFRVFWAFSLGCCILLQGRGPEDPGSVVARGFISHEAWCPQHLFGRLKETKYISFFFPLPISQETSKGARGLKPAEAFLSSEILF